MKAYCKVCQKKQKMKMLTHVDDDVEIKHKCPGCRTIYISFVELPKEKPRNAL